MATESIGELIPTAIPGYADAADIQAALRAYHYGSYAYSPANTSPGNLVSPSMAKTIYDIQQDIVDLENRPSSGGDVATTAPVPGDFTPSGIPNGYIWVDQDGTIGGQPISATAVFTASAPTSNLSTGVIWVDQDPASISDNPFIATALLSAKGDLIVASANDAATVLNVAATNGYVLNVSSSTTSGLAWVDSAASTQTLTNKTINLTSNTLSGTVAQFNTALSDGDFATLAGTETLTGKTISGTSNTITDVAITSAVSGLGTNVATFLATPSSANFASALTDETGSGAVVFATSPSLTTPSFSSIVNTGTLTLPTSTDTLVGRATTDTLTNKTITSALNTTPILRSPEERWNVVASAATGTVNFDANTSGILYYTSNSTGNWTLNVRGDSGTTLNTMLTTNDSITVVFFATNGSPAYYQTAFQIDGNAVTPKWQNGVAPSAGNTSSIDIYSFTIVKTGNAAFTAFGSQTKFA